MKRYILLLSLSLSQNVTAQCLYHDDIQASYDISTKAKTQNNTHHQQLMFLRKKDNVIYQNVTTKITELWHLQSNQAISLTRYFDSEKQAIEYQASEIKSAKSWQQLKLMIAPSLLKTMQLKKSLGVGCHVEQHYILTTTFNSKKDSKIKNQTLKLTWLPKLQLVKSLVITNSQRQTTWQLKNFNTDTKKIATAFQNWQTYQTTDYADIGDNESDPFIAKMINQGFVKHGASGLYLADGSLIKQVHSH